MKWFAPLALFLLVACPQEAPAPPPTPEPEPAPATPPTADPAKPKPTMPLPDFAAPGDPAFTKAAAEYCKHERPMVIDDPIQSKNIAKREAAGETAAIRDEAKWIPFCLQKQGKLRSKFGEEKVLAYYACAADKTTLVELRTKCFREVFLPPKKG